MIPAMNHRTGRARTVQPLVALLGAATATAAALLATHPALAPSPASWSGDDLAVTILWWSAVIASIWLAATTLLCVAALARGRTGSAHRIARFAPPIARRALLAALISTSALAPTAAYATPSSSSSSSSGTITVHADRGGRFITETGGAAPNVIHASAPRQSHRPTSTSTTPSTTTTTTSAPAPIASHHEAPSPVVAPIKHSPTPTPALTPTPPPTPAPTPTPTPTSRPPPAPIAPVSARMHVVVSGDNLWQIARTEVARRVDPTS